MPYPPQGGAPADIAASVWAYTARRLTNLDDIRAALIDNIDVLLSRIGDPSPLTIVDMLTTISEYLTDVSYWAGGVLMDGTEKDMMEIPDYPTYVDGRYSVEGALSLHPMQAGDTIVIREYMAIYANGVPTYHLYASHTYNDAQTEPLVRFTKKTINTGWKVTAQQTAGVNRNIPYAFSVKYLA